MTRDEVIRELVRLGTAQNRKVYARHGVAEPMYGVSYANQSTLAKRIKRDHPLAQALWGTGNHDARILATKIADPTKATPRLLDAWARQLPNYVLTEAVSAFAAATPFAAKKRAQWISAKGEWIPTAGWNLWAHAALDDDALEDVELLALIDRIERTMHESPNRTRYAMNGALIAIGLRNPALRRAAIAAAKRIGKVHVEHGETGCRTPDAAAYIRKATTRKTRT